MALLLSNGALQTGCSVEEHVGPDSAKARHILISPTEAVAAVWTKRLPGHSLKKLIVSGVNV